MDTEQFIRLIYERTCVRGVRAIQVITHVTFVAGYVRSCSV